MTDLAMYDHDFIILNLFQREHRQFLEFIDTWQPLRGLIETYGCEKFKEQYNEFVEELIDFRSKHIQVRKLENPFS